MNALDLQRRLEQEPDFILLKRFSNSLAELLERYPEGAPENVIAKALGMEEDEVEEFYQRVVLKLRRNMGVVVDSIR